MQSGRIPTAALAALLLFGCQSQRATPPSPPPSVTGAPLSGSTGSSEVAFKTSDGWTIHADFSPTNVKEGTAHKAVILLHQRGGSAADWIPVIGKLNSSGIATLAVDQRGAGRSTGAANGEDAPWDTTGDIAAALDWLKGKSIFSTHVGLAGASYGANNALIYASTNSAIPAVTLLSPGADYHGLKIADAARKASCSILVLTATGDSITSNGPQLVKQNSAKSQLNHYSGDAHGTNLFSSHPESIDALVSFFKTKL